MNMRRGVTLLEVLFSIILLSVGILGSVAVFSMAMAQARKGRTADTVQVAAHSAVSSFTAEGMDDRTRWLRWDAANSQTAFFPLNMNDAPSASAPNPYYGRAFCIDPRGFEQNRITDIQQGQTNSGLWAWFPAVPEVSPTPNAVPNGSRMMRLTLTNGPTGAAPMPFAMADKLFRVEDELIYERPEDNTLPAIGLHTQVDTGSGNIAGRRQEEGRATWMATLVPKLAPAKEARLELQGGTYVERKLDVVPNEYVLSVAVFYNRTPDMEVPNAGDRPWNEWTAKVCSRGTSTLRATAAVRSPSRRTTRRKTPLSTRSNIWTSPADHGSCWPGLFPQPQRPSNTGNGIGFPMRPMSALAAIAGSET
jgi:Tfp pilus assembly protein PilV